MLAAAGVLDGATATTHFADIGDLEANHPETSWIRGERYVDDGRITTTAGVTSGVTGALHLVERFAGEAEAQRIGREVGAASWQGSSGTAIPVNVTGPQDYPYLLGAALPWFRPIWGIVVTPGSDEIEVAAAFEVYSGSSFAVELVPIAETSTVKTRNGMTLVAATTQQVGEDLDRIVVPASSAARVESIIGWSDSNMIPVCAVPSKDGESSFDPLLRDLAHVTDSATTTTLAKYIEYPLGDVPAEASVPSRLLALVTVTALSGIVAGVLAWMLVRPGSSLRAVLGDARRRRIGHQSQPRSRATPVA